MIIKNRVVALVCATGMIISGNGGVPAEAAGTPVFLSKTNITLKEGTSKTITVKKTGKVSIKKKTFQTSDKKVATVTKKGKITAKKAGTATIEAAVKYKKGKKTKSATLKCRVTVKGKGSGNNKSNHSASTAAPVTAASQNPSGTDMPTEAPATPAKPTNVPEGNGKAAGLYDQDGKLVKTWEQLKQEGALTVEHGVVWYGNSEELSGELVIGEEVTGIGMYAFDCCSGLTSVTIPESVTTIECQAFWGCSSLTNVVIPDSVTRIEGRAFQDTAWLTKKKAEEDFVIGGKVLISAGKKDSGNIVIPEGVTSIGECAFWNCSNLTGVTIPEGVTKINAMAFSGCSSLASVTIPDSVTFIGRYAFEETAWLMKERAEKDFVIGGSVLISPGKKDSGDIVIPEGVTSIVEFAFDNFDRVTSVTVPESVTSIGGYAFHHIPLVIYDGNAWGMQYWWALKVQKSDGTVLYEGSGDPEEV